MLTAEERDALVAELAQRPGHEKVRVLLHRLLVAGLGAASREIDFEKPAPEVRGRIDALLGRTVFELKSDLRRERKDAAAALARYLAQREGATGERYTGIATDGADFTAFFLKDGHAVEVAAHRASPHDSRALLVWLQGAVAIGEDLLPDPYVVKREFGRNSLAARRALDDLAAFWSAVGHTPEARLKRELWGRLLGLAYGEDVGDDALFMQHSYLAIVAKAVAWAAVIAAPPPNAAALLHGGAFSDLGIASQSEPDFFDWPLAATGGAELAMQIVRQVNRFRLSDLRVDILKALYEGLIDPETRHDLGEYYTPDWLAARMVAEAMDKPLEQRLLDPACGSGTFLFHALRAVLAAAEGAGRSPAQAVRLALDKVAGIDIHPVAVIFARVTCLLALAPTLRQEHPGDVSLPVYLGDALQWNLSRANEQGTETPSLLADDNRLEISVPAIDLAEPRPRRLARATLRFPAAVASNPVLFDRMVTAMIDHGARAAPADHFATWIDKNMAASPEDRRILGKTYRTMRRLHEEGRDHIWGYVARNLARPVWLAKQKADVIVGNPPWVSFRYMAADFGQRFRDECHAARLWVGGKVATQQDLSGYFYLRAALLYLRPQGRMALVMPYAALSRRAYAPFRKGEAVWAGQVALRLRFTAAWTFGADVSPLFPVPCCVLFAERHRGAMPAALPGEVRAFAGILPRRDASEAQADILEDTIAPWPTEAIERRESPYRRAFRNGATLVPRRLVLVESVPVTGILAANPVAPLVRGRVGNQDKKPWSAVTPPQGVVEREFLRPVLLGESIAPFRVLALQRAVVPWDEERGVLLDAKQASASGVPRLMRWLEQTERLWDRHKRSALSLTGQCDYYGKLSCQFPIAPLRVVYTKAGTTLAAATVRDGEAVVDHVLYWSAVETMAEARYLCGILNSEILRAGVEDYQARGQWGPRHFDKYVFNLPIPRFDGGDPLHRRLAAAAREAERVAAAIALDQGLHFTRARRAIRAALAAHGIAARLERLARTLLRGAR